MYYSLWILYLLWHGSHLEIIQTYSLYKSYVSGRHWGKMEVHYCLTLVMLNTEYVLHSPLNIYPDNLQHSCCKHVLFFNQSGRQCRSSTSSGTMYWIVQTNKNTLGLVYICVQGSYRQVCVKFKDFSRLSYSFQGLKVYEKSWFSC